MHKKLFYLMKLRNLISVALIATIIILSGCSENKTQQDETIQYVKTEKVSPKTEAEKLVFNGTIQEQSLTTLSFRVGGPIIKLNVKMGDYVKKGDVIASIDKRDYELQVKSTKAQYQQLEGEYKRYKELYEKNKIPANSYEKIESGYLMAKTGYDNAVNQLRDTDLKAPFSGYIHQKMVENFQTIGPGIPIVSMIDISKLEVVIAIPENLINKVKHSDENYLSVKNANVTDLPIHLLNIDGKTGNDGMYKMKFNFTNEPSYNIYPGMSAEVTMYCHNPNETMRIPATSIIHENNKNFVWLYNINTQTVKKNPVKIIRIANNGYVEISSGLKYGDIIITAGVNYLFEGQKVEPIKEISKTNIGGLL